MPMKKYLLLFMCGVVVAFAQAQTTLTSESHGFVANERNPMKLTKYVEPGLYGKNIVWDFSNLDITSNFEGLILDKYTSKCSDLFPKGNIVLEEFGNFFLFQTSAEKLVQFGFISSSGNTKIVYTKPFVKMQYPFTYGTKFSGNFEGDYIVNNLRVGEIRGSYSVDGDAKGLLLLPNGKELSNALRVKEVKTYKQTINSNAVNVEDITYRWYVENHRFPVLVLIKSTYHSNGTPVISTKAAFNSNVMGTTNLNELLIDNLKIDIYPNPYQGRVTVAYNLGNTSNVNISVYDLSGKLISVLANGVESAGLNKHYFSAAELGMPAGVYVVKFKIGDSEISRKILEVK